MEIEYQIIKRNDNFCTDENQFICLLETNQCYKIKKEQSIIEYKGKEIKYNIKKYETKGKQEIMYIIKFSLEDESQIEEFEKFDKSFLDFISKFDDLSINVLWDDISRKYADIMYPKIAYIENLLRKIIYYFMGKNVGKNWTKKCFPKDVENSIKSVKDKNQIETDENILYYADFIQLNFLLFVKYSNEVISQNELVEKLKCENCDKKELISKYEYKSNWDRYFEPVVNKESLEENFGKVYGYRNLVAHNRKIRKKDKDKADILIKNIENVLKNCLSKIDKISVPEEEKDNLENMSYQMLNPTENVLEKYPGIASFMNSFKIDFGIRPAIESTINSLKVDLGTSSAVKSVIESLKTDTSAMMIAKNVVDSANVNLKLESPVKETIDIMKNNNPILSLNSSIDKEEDKK